MEQFVRSIQPGQPQEESGGRALLAFGSAMVWPGVAHLIAGEQQWAVMWFLSWCTILGGFAMVVIDPEWLMLLPVLVLFAVAIQVTQLIHATRCMRNSSRVAALEPGSRMGLGVLCAVVAIAGYWGVIRYLQRDWIEVCYSPTPSMSPAISPGDYFLNFKRAPIHRWDIVGVQTPKNSEVYFENLCKRLIGLPGDRIEITADKLLINSTPVNLPEGLWRPIAVDMYNKRLTHPDPLGAANGCWGRPIVLGSDEYFMLGDNSSISYDCRFWPSINGRKPGAVPQSQLRGRVVAIIWPPQRWRIFPSHAGE